MTLADVEQLDRDYLTPKEVAAILHCAPYYLNTAAREGKLPFPAFLSGKKAPKLKIPREGFLNFMRGGNGRDSNHQAVADPGERNFPEQEQAN